MSARFAARGRISRTEAARIAESFARERGAVVESVRVRWGLRAWEAELKIRACWICITTLRVHKRTGEVLNPPPCDWAFLCSQTPLPTGTSGEAAYADRLGEIRSRYRVIDFEPTLRLDPPPVEGCLSQIGLWRGIPVHDHECWVTWTAGGFDTFDADSLVGPPDLCLLRLSGDNADMEAQRWMREHGIRLASVGFVCW